MMRCNFIAIPVYLSLAFARDFFIPAPCLQIIRSSTLRNFPDIISLVIMITVAQRENHAYQPKNTKTSSATGNPKTRQMVRSNGVVKTGIRVRKMMTGLIIGMFAGSCIGVLAASLIFAAKQNVMTDKG